jgi:uncharacterized SAM-binding protein YcdF (DUF218 family)
MILRLLATLLLAWLFGFVAFALTLPQPAPDARRTDAIVVLTGSAGRIERGLALLRAGRGDALLVSGVDRDVRPAEFAAQFNVSRALMKCCVTLGREAIDTRSNAIETSGWLARRHDRSARLITADWHMRRARYELARQLTEPIEILPDAVQSRPTLLALLREYDKYLARRAAGFIGI